VVVARGALETPALLLRSGIGGPAAGRRLHLHPAGAVSGVYEDDQRPWWGPAQAAIVDEFAGRVTIDGDGQALRWYPLDDELDQRHFRRGLAELARIHKAAGAAEIIGLHPSVPPWRRGDDLDAWIERLCAVPLGAGGQPVFSAHQMGTARMGADPAGSVANPLRELHDPPGVWIGDTSALPTAIGVNPMVTGAALARRTARAILT
jgi:choline dehydrogenase-like flavoprotein